MFCIYCGNALPSNAIFCNSCGRRQNVTTPSISTTAIRPEVAVSEQPSGSVQRVTDHMPSVQEPPVQTNSFPVTQQTPPLLNSFLASGTAPTTAAASVSTPTQNIGAIMA